MGIKHFCHLIIDGAQPANAPVLQLSRFGFIRKRFRFARFRGRVTELSGRPQMRFRIFCEFACIVAFHPRRVFFAAVGYGRIFLMHGRVLSTFPSTILGQAPHSPRRSLQTPDSRPGMAQVRHHCGNHGILPWYGALELRMSPGQRRRAAEQTANRDLAGPRILPVIRTDTMFPRNAGAVSATTCWKAAGNAALLRRLGAASAIRSNMVDRQG